MKEKTRTTPISTIVLVIALLIAFIMSMIGGRINTSGGTVKVSEFNIVTNENLTLHGNLYIPKTATPENPAPGVLLTHGAASDYDMMTSLAIELSRRGYIALAIDAYGSGETDLNDAVAHPEWDHGTYAALQYLGSMRQVDKDKIAMVGHSRGNLWGHNGAVTAFELHETDPSVIVPASMVLLSFNFPISVEADGTYRYAMNDYPVNVAEIFGDYDEFGAAMWSTLPSEYRTSAVWSLGTGVGSVESGTYFAWGDPTPLTTEEAVAVAHEGRLRAGFSYPQIHMLAVLSSEPISYAIEFLDVTLRDGQTAINSAEQVWFGRQVTGCIAMYSLFVAFVALAFTLLRLPFFATIIRPEPKSISAVTDVKSGIRYAVIFILLLVPTMLLYFYYSGFPALFPNAQPLTYGEYFSSPTNNPSVLMNLTNSVVLVAAFYLIYRFIAKKNGITAEDLGLKMPIAQVGKALLLAIMTFGIMYVFICFCFDTSGVFISWLKFAMSKMDEKHWAVFFKYLPFWLLVYLVQSFVLNMLTRINNAKEWVNYLLIILASVGGYATLMIIQYTVLYSTGVVAIPISPYNSMPTSLANNVLFGLVMITPVGGIMLRTLHKKTGSFWVGGFLTAFVVLMFAACHTVIQVA